MTGSRWYLVAWIGAALAVPVRAAAPAVPVEAEFVETTTSGLVLVQTARGREVVALVPGATLVGLASPQALRPGDRLRYVPSREEGGVRLATSLELLPAIATDPEHGIGLGELLPLLAARQGAAPGPRLLDLRSEEAFARGHLSGATSAARWRTALASLLPPERQAPLVLYGASRQDASGAEALRAALALGYRNVRLYAAGYREWSDENRPTLVRARDLARRLGAEPLVVLDVRPADEAARGSTPRGVAVVPSTMRSRDWVDRPAMPALVLMGRDGADPVPLEVAEQLRLWQPGSRSLPPGTILILEGGFEAWAAAGGKLEPPHRSLDEVPCVPLPGEICPADFLRLWREGSAPGAPLLVDVRSSAAAYRPPWAQHVPIAELPRRVAELPRDREVVVFCARGITSRVAQAVMERAGLKARFARLPAPQQP
jgi:rhodanese-related sulfurtransferase